MYYNKMEGLTFGSPEHCKNVGKQFNRCLCGIYAPSDDSSKKKKKKKAKHVSPSAFVRATKLLE